MRILFDSREQTRNITGIGIYVKNLAREIQALRMPDVECLFVPKNPQKPPEGGAIRPLSTQFANFVRNVAWKQALLPILAQRARADMLICMDPVGPLVSPVPTALILYDLIFLTSGAQTDAWTRYWRFLVPLCARKSDLVFTPSRATKTKIRDLLGIPEENVVVFRTGVASHFRPVDWTAAEADRMRRERGLPASFLLTVGAHDPRRNIKVVLQAFHHLKSTGSLQQKLVVIGPKTPYFKEVLQTTRSLGLDKDVLYLDFIPNEELYAYYGLADLYLYPSSEEGFGLTPLEAMACGCPVITSRISSLPEVVGEAALLVDPQNPEALARAIERCLTNVTLRTEFVEKGLERAKNFSWNAGAVDIVNACRERIGIRPR